MSFSDDKGREYEVSSMVGAYNTSTKEANIYMEVERTQKSSFIKYMESLGAFSVQIKTFSHVNWRVKSSDALAFVIEFANKTGLTLVKTGVKPQATPTLPSTNVTAQSGIYVLSVGNHQSKPSFYVGKSNDIAIRIQQHSDGVGAFCISGEPFTRVEPITKGSTDDMESWERNEVLTRMHEFGIDNVRGWMYTLKTMPLEQKLSAFDQICEKFDFCRKCGRNSHFIRDCKSMSTDLWTCGLELRSAYHGANQGAEHKINEARRMVEEAARVLGTL